MWRVLFEMMWKNELHHILFSLYAKILQWCTADANREKSEFGLKKEKKGKKDIKKEIKERKNYKKETPTPTLTLSPRFTDTQRENTSASTTGGGSTSTPTGTAPVAGSSGVSKGPTPHNDKRFLARNAGKMTLIEAKHGNLNEETTERHARPVV